jgi:peptide deformylase
MAIREIIRLGHPVLREVAKPVPIDEIQSSEMASLIKDMWVTMEKASGMGLAAPQIAISKQLAVIEIPEHSTRYDVEQPSERYVIFNPVIKSLTEETAGLWEGCLSLPGLRGYVPRPTKIEVDFYDEKAQKRHLVLEDLLAIVFQHEIDHLNGLLFIDRMPDLAKLSFEKEYVDFHLEPPQ